MHRAKETITIFIFSYYKYNYGWNIVDFNFNPNLMLFTTVSFNLVFFFFCSQIYSLTQYSRRLYRHPRTHSNVLCDGCSLKRIKRMQYALFSFVFFFAVRVSRARMLLNCSVRFFMHS